MPPPPIPQCSQCPLCVHPLDVNSHAHLHMKYWHVPPQSPIATNTPILYLCVHPLDMNSHSYLHMEYPLGWHLPHPMAPMAPNAPNAAMCSPFRHELICSSFKNFHQN